MKYKIHGVKLGDGTHLYNVLKKNWWGGFYTIHTVNSLLAAQKLIPWKESFELEIDQ